MGLFDSFNPLEMLLQGGQETSNQNLANKAGLDMGDFGKIATIGLPIILSAIKKNTQTPEGLESFDNALTKHQDVTNYNNLDQLTQNVDPQDGDKILGHVFDDKQSIFERIGSTLGLSPDAVKRALIVVAPLILKYMADRKNSNQLDRNGLQEETNRTFDQITNTIQEKGALPNNVPNGESIIDAILSGREANRVDQQTVDHARQMGQDQLDRVQQDKESKSGSILGSILDLFKK